LLLLKEKKVKPLLYKGKNKPLYSTYLEEKVIIYYKTSLFSLLFRGKIIIIYSKTSVFEGKSL